MAVAHKSAISVGMLYIPVGLYKTTKDISVSFNQLCKDTHERVKYK
ncbi:MAG: Ku protein [Lacrimispora sp.]|jgi:DNA end-binding protein Ku|nr:Ku protein [Lacrimispora sp.]